MCNWWGADHDHADVRVVEHVSGRRVRGDAPFACGKVPACRRDVAYPGQLEAGNLGDRCRVVAGDSTVSNQPDADRRGRPMPSRIHERSMHEPLKRDVSISGGRAPEPDVDEGAFPELPLIGDDLLGEMPAGADQD